MAAPIAVGSERQLFLDDLLIERTENLARRVRPLRKHAGNPVIRREEDWEPRSYLLFGSVIYDEDEGVWKAWSDGREGGVFYFTSPDGVHWERPALDLFPIDGHPTNRIVLPPGGSLDPGWRNFQEFFGVSNVADEPDPARRYRMGWLWLDRDWSGPNEARFHPGQRRGLGVAVSPDGVHWTPLDEPATHATCDGQTHWFFDERTGRWMLYGRTKHVDPRKREVHGAHPHFGNNWGRSVALAQSEDFLHWTPDEGELVLTADELDAPLDEIYSMGVFPYEGLYIGLVQVFHNYPEVVWLDIQLATSRDGVHFERLSDRSPLIACGEVGEWDRFNHSVANNAPIAVGDELRFYYSGRSAVHTSRFAQADDGKGVLGFDAAIGFGTLKRDRFAGMEAGFDGGTLLTKPLLLGTGAQGDRLFINADAAFGIVEVELLSMDGAQLAAATVQAEDATEIAVPLDLTAHAGEPVRVRFTVRNARLYAMWVG